MLLASRDIIGGVAWVPRQRRRRERRVRPPRRRRRQFAGGEILGKTLGVIGLGAIGELVAQRPPIGAGHERVIGYDPCASDEITVHEQLSPTVRVRRPAEGAQGERLHHHPRASAWPPPSGMIDADAIAQMKDGVVFLNFSRDALVDDAAMAEALDIRQGGGLRDRLRHARAVVKMERAIVHPASGRLDRRGRGQLRQDGRGGNHGLPGARREDPLREYVETR